MPFIWQASGSGLKELEAQQASLDEQMVAVLTQNYESEMKRIEDYFARSDSVELKLERKREERDRSHWSSCTGAAEEYLTNNVTLVEFDKRRDSPISVWTSLRGAINAKAPGPDAQPKLIICLNSRAPQTISSKEQDVAIALAAIYS